MYVFACTAYLRCRCDDIIIDDNDYENGEDYDCTKKRLFSTGTLTVVDAYATAANIIIA